MARINVEERWWGSAYRVKLGKLLKEVPFEPEDLTESVMIRAWRTAQEYWQRGELIPGREFMSFLAADAILLSGLARIHLGKNPDSELVEMPFELRFAERRPNDRSNEYRTRLNDYLTTAERNWVYVNGSENSFKWAIDARQQRVEAGKKSAEKRRLTNGTAQPLSNDRSNEPERPFERDSTETNEIERSGSVSVSGSSSESSSVSVKKNTGGIRIEYPKEFDDIWKQYGIKGEKKAAYIEFKKLNYSKDELANLSIAITNYHAKKPDPQFRKDFERFLPTDWREWLKPENISNGVHPKTQERINTFERFKQREEQKAAEAAKGVTNEFEN